VQPNVLVVLLSHLLKRCVKGFFRASEGVSKEFRPRKSENSEPATLQFSITTTVPLRLLFRPFVEIVPVTLYYYLASPIDTRFYYIGAKQEFIPSDQKINMKFPNDMLLAN